MAKYETLITGIGEMAKSERNSDARGAVFLAAITRERRGIYRVLCFASSLDRQSVDNILLAWQRRARRRKQARDRAQRSGRHVRA